MTKEQQAKLERAKIIWVATVRAGGRPHLVPVWFVWAAGKLYICVAPRSVKARNLEANPRISLALEDGSHPLICEGDARVVEPPWPDAAVAGFRVRYQWDITAETEYTRLVEVTPRKWLAW